jgi:peptide deformylase
MGGITVVMNIELVPKYDPILTTLLTEDFNFENPQVDPADLAVAMVDFMRSHNGIGLSANQIGLNFRVFAMEGEPAHVCFNPRIVSQSDEQILLEEGCLSYPGLIVKVKRSRHCRIRFVGPDGETYTEQFTGMTARVIQHEVDHLDGVLFFDRANRFHREQAFNKWEKQKRRAVEFDEKIIQKALQNE